MSYSDGQRITVHPGVTVLEASRLNGIPHASVCGGRGRCSTCRVLVREGAEHLPPPNESELEVLRRVGAPGEVRLACQIRPTRDISVMPLLPSGTRSRDAFQRPAYIHGGERQVAILFADLRGFTRFAENKLPYDVVFVLNEYFRVVGQAVERAGGHIDKFIGDGVMALFGLETEPEQGCRQALDATVGICLAVDELNRTLAAELEEPLRIGIGLHMGPVIVGEMGYRRATSVTAIGDAVNIASRLEAMTKDFDAQLVVSRQLTRLAGVDLSGFPRHQIEVRGRQNSMNVYVIGRTADLPAIGEASTAAAPAAAPATNPA